MINVKDMNSIFKNLNKNYEKIYKDEKIIA